MHVNTFNRAPRRHAMILAIKVGGRNLEAYAEPPLDIFEGTEVFSSDFDAIDLPHDFTDVEIVPGIVAHLGYSGGTAAPVLEHTRPSV